MRDYKSYFIVSEEPEIVYKALTSENTIRLWTGAPATFIDKSGEEFSFYKDTLNGQNLELIPSTSIIQQWYLQEIDKPEDASIVSFKLFPHKKGTSILLEQSNIPDEMYDDIVEGWEGQFMKDLIGFFSD